MVVVAVVVAVVVVVVGAFSFDDRRDGVFGALVAEAGVLGTLGNGDTAVDDSAAG